MRKHRLTTGSIYNVSKSKQKRNPLQAKDMNTQRTIVKNNHVIHPYNNQSFNRNENRWAYDYDNIQSSKMSKQQTKQYEFQSSESKCSKKSTKSRQTPVYDQDYQHVHHSLQDQIMIHFDSFNNALPNNLCLRENIYDSLSFYEKKSNQQTQIVKKLTSLNNIFKEIKLLRNMDVGCQVEKILANVEDKLLTIQRQIIKQQTANK